MKKLCVYLIGVAFLGGGVMSVQSVVEAQAKAEALFNKRCGTCHSVARATSQKKSKTAWKGTVKRMRKNGCSLTDEEAQLITEYLAEKYGQ